MKKRVLIEPLLFGDFYVAIYDYKDNLLLDKKYFCAGITSAIFCASKVAFKEKLDIFIIWDGKETNINSVVIDTVESLGDGMEENGML